MEFSQVGVCECIRAADKGSWHCGMFSHATTDMNHSLALNEYHQPDDISLTAVKVIPK